MFKISISNKYTFVQKNISIGKGNNIITVEDINKLLHILNLEKIKEKSEYFKSLINQLNVDYNDSLLTFHMKKKYLNYVKDKIMLYQKYFTSYMIDACRKKEQLFKKVKRLKDCTLPVYDHNTTTGRIKITAGTNFLVMKTEARKQLRHIDSNTCLYEIDFNSCEPFFFLNYLNVDLTNVNDIYSHLMKKFDINMSRIKFKRFLLSLMYGADENILSKLSNIKIKKIKSIKKELKIDKFSKDLIEKYEKKGYIENFYKRPLLSKNNLINHWIQSSTADYCCLAFNEFLEKNKNINLHGIIHDAIIVSAKNDIDVTHLKESISEIKIPVSIKKIG